MNARERFPLLAKIAERGIIVNGEILATGREARAALDELDELIGVSLTVARQAREIGRLNAALTGEHDTGH